MLAWGTTETSSSWGPAPLWTSTSLPPGWRHALDICILGGRAPQTPCNLGPCALQTSRILGAAPPKPCNGFSSWLYMAYYMAYTLPMYMSHGPYDKDSSLFMHMYIYEPCIYIYICIYMEYVICDIHICISDFLSEMHKIKSQRYCQFM